VSVGFQFPARNSGCSDHSGATRTIRRAAQFQFPARNSGCSDKVSVSGGEKWRISFNSSLGILSVRTNQGASTFISGIGVSIPHSEFCLFGHAPRRYNNKIAIIVSIPHSEFCLFGPLSSMLSKATLSSFNSSLGILSVRTNIKVCAGQSVQLFQFLTRNSVCSD